MGALGYLAIQFLVGIAENVLENKMDFKESVSNTTIIIGAGTNSSFSNFTFFAGVGNYSNKPAIAYSTSYGLGYGNAGNPGFNEFYYPSVNYQEFVANNYSISYP